MATSRRRTNKSSVGQNLNELERRIKAVERRPTPSYLGDSLIASDSVADGSITIDSLDDTLRNLLFSAFSNASTTGASLGVSGSEIVQNTSNITSNGFSVSGRTTVFYQSTAPSSEGRIEDDLWYDSSNDYKPYRWGFETVQITQAVVTSPSAVFTTSTTHAIQVGEVLTLFDLAGSATALLLNGAWLVTATTGTTITVDLEDLSGTTDGTYTGLTGRGVSNTGEWIAAMFGDEALSGLVVGKLLTGKLNVATIATVGNETAFKGEGTGGSVVINGGSAGTGTLTGLTQFTGIKLFKPDGTNTVFLDALTGNATFTGTVNATGGSFSGSVSAGNLKIGLDVNGTNDGIYINAYNYWYDTGYFSVGDATKNMVWNGTTLTVTGTINATAGNFTSTVTIGSGSTSGTLAIGTDTTNIKIVGTNSSSTTAIYSGTTTASTGSGFFLSADGKARIASSSGALTFDGSDLKVGGFTIGASSLTAGSGSSAVGLVSTGTAGTIAIYAGDSTPANAEFRVTNQGALTATSATVTGVIQAETGYIGGSSGWTISSGLISNSLTESNTSADVYLSAPSSMTSSNSTFQMLVYNDISSDFYSKGIFGLRYASIEGLSSYINLGARVNNPVFYFPTQVVVTGTSPNQTAVISFGTPVSIASGQSATLAGFGSPISNLNATRTVSSKTSTTLTFTGLSNLTSGTYTSGLSIDSANVSGIFEQNLQLFSMTPASSSYASVLHGLPSIAIDGPDGTVAGMIGAYAQKIFGLEAVSGQAFITINDTYQYDRSVYLGCAGGSSNAYSSDLYFDGTIGYISISGYSPTQSFSLELNPGIISLGASGTNNSQISLTQSTKTINIYSADDVSGIINLVGSVRRTGMATRRYYNETSGTGTALTAGTWITVNYNTVNYAAVATASAYGTSNSGSIYWYTVPHSGYYRVSGAVYFDGGTGVGRREVRIQLVDNGTTPTSSTSGDDYCYVSVPATATDGSVQFNDIVLADEANDKILIWARMVSDTGVNVNEGINRTFLTIEYVGSID